MHFLKINNAKWGTLHRSRSPMFVPIESSLRDFLLLSNLPPILHRFRYIAFDRSKIAIFGYSSCLTPPTEGFPWDDLRKPFRGQGTKCRRNIAENTTARVGYTSVINDRRQADGRYHIANVNMSSRSLKMSEVIWQVLSSSWDGRSFVHNGHGPKIGVCAPLLEGSWVPI